MTEYAVPGKPHQTIPTDIEEWSVDFEYVVLPWMCPGCEQLVAETVAHHRPIPFRTVLVAGSPVHRPEADDAGVPFFGPSTRVMRGKSERRATHRLSHESSGRARSQDQQRRPDLARPGEDRPQWTADHSPIEAEVFDTVCDNCPRRLRIDLATGLARRLR